MKRLKLNRWLISVVAFAMLVLVFQSDEAPTLSVLQTDIPDSDYFMQNVTVYQYDQGGSITNTLRANRMQHYIDKNLSILTKPTIIYNRSQTGNWILQSPRGELVNDVELTLLDSVTIEEFNQSKQSESKISTKNLLINLQRNVASTQEKVLIESPFLKAKSDGFEFDLGKEIIQLTANVRTEIYQQ